MGWLEVLALLKRILPLLGRVAPMLEAFLAARAGSSTEADVAFQRFGEDLRADREAAAKKHDNVAAMLASQDLHITAIRSDLRQMRETADRDVARLLALEYQLATVSKWLRLLILLTVAVLLLCAVLLVMLLRHRL